MDDVVRRGPLVGLRVVELAGIGPAPLGCRMLSDLGADVLRIDRAGDAPVQDGLTASRTRLVLDLKDPDAVERVLSLVQRADVLVEAYRPGTTERLGLGPDVCLARNPRLVYARMTGWGQFGPLAATAGHDINYLAVTGALHAIGEPGRGPVIPLNLVADFGGGSMFLLSGVLAALVERSSSGQGQVVDVAMVDGASALLSMTWAMRGAGQWRDERGRNLVDGGAPFYSTYPCADGRHIAVGALEPQFYAQLVAGLGLSDPPPQYDEAGWPAMRKQLAAAFLTRTRDDWAQVFGGTDACVTPVLSLSEAASSTHLQARGTLPAHDGAVRPAPAPRFSRTPGAVAPDGRSDELLARWAEPD